MLCAPASVYKARLIHSYFIPKYLCDKKGMNFGINPSNFSVGDFTAAGPDVSFLVRKILPGPGTFLDFYRVKRLLLRAL